MKITKDYIPEINISSFVTVYLLFGGNYHTFNKDLKIHTFWQFPFISSGRFGLFTPAGPSAAEPTDDRHGVIIASKLQGVPV